MSEPAWTDVCQRHGISLVVLFGSQATGATRADSDMDLGVLVDKYPLEPEQELALIRDFVHTLRRADLDVTVLNHAAPLLCYHVARDGVPLYERDPQAFARYRFRAWKRFIDTARFRRLKQDYIEAFLRGDSDHARQVGH
ncbi:MAG: nucleotidyltransferase domain-containing protein [Chloroflexi bacterium]|nr:nucleotidyltransferase domain-containing protein [Chloroflexota bacterium]MBU1748101.1 nucleotidyltransferase domain-containing protein [Chloroflexota bacterium]